MITVILEHARFISFKLIYFRFISFLVCLGGWKFDRPGLKGHSTKYKKLASRERKFNILLNIYPWAPLYILSRATPTYFRGRGRD